MACLSKSNGLNVRSIKSSVELAKAVSPITPVNKTPRRSPRLATNDCSRINTPVKHALRSFVAKKASNMVLESQSSLEIFSLHHLKSYIDECEDYFSLNADVVTADAGKNRIQNFLIVTRKLKSYDDDIGPYDAVRLVVNEDGCYRLLAHDSLLEDSTISTPFHTSSVVDILNKLSDCTWVVCLGIKGYSVYHTSIGYHLNRVVLKKCIPDTARDHECAIMYQQQSRRCSPVCSKCMSLKWQLARRKREHDDLTLSERATRQSTSSNVPFDILSPVSKKARVESMRKSIKICKLRLIITQ